MDNAKENIMARLHLEAILPLLEDIASYDSQIKDAVKDWRLTLQFQLPGGDPATALIFTENGISAKPGGVQGSKVTLTFKDARSLNDIFQGRSKKSPRPNLQGLFHVKKLMGLDQVLGRLEHYLKPSEEMLNNPETFTFCVKLTLTALAYGLKVVGEHDPELSPVAAKLPDGVLEMRIVNGPAVHIRIDKGKFFPARGAAEKPNAYLEIADMGTAWAMLQGQLDLFAAMGSCTIKMRGYIPLLDGVNPLMDRLSLYLSS